MVQIVYGTNNQWYERSLGRMVHGTNGLHVVRIVRGTNSQWYEKSRHHFPNETATENAGVENAIRSKMQGWKMQE